SIPNLIKFLYPVKPKYSPYLTQLFSFYPSAIVSSFSLLHRSPFIPQLPDRLKNPRVTPRQLTSPWQSSSKKPFPITKTVYRHSSLNKPRLDTYTLNRTVPQ